MTKRPSKTQILVADGSGGLRPMADMRAQDSDWPIQKSIKADNAEEWMAQLNAEIEIRNWTSGSITQLDTSENSGSISIQTKAGPSSPSLHITWERQRGKELKFKAKPSDDPVLPIETAQEFLFTVSERVRLGTIQQIHSRVLLAYNGLPWHGELWLDPEHRLGPPTKHPDVLLGPQILVVDMLVQGIGRQGISADISRRLRELQLFLGFVLGVHLEANRFEEGWICEVGAESQVMESKLGYLGYFESVAQNGMPLPNVAKKIEKRSVERPGLGPYGIHSDMAEQWVPSDIEELWEQFKLLPVEKHSQLLNAANALRCAHAMWPEQRTAYVTFHVVACEALKPKGKKHDKLNIYDVVASLLGKENALKLYELTHHPQKVRSRHLHRGELTAGELLLKFEQSYFGDPSFDSMLMLLARLTRTCLIEWLRCKGIYKPIKLGSGPINFLRIS